MVELIKSGVLGIACIQPFACLPNHVTGKGMIKELRRHYPEAQISAIDYDPGASEVNQLNRLKLLLANAPYGTHPDDTKRQYGKSELGSFHNFTAGTFGTDNSVHDKHPEALDA